MHTLQIQPALKLKKNNCHKIKEKKNKIIKTGI